MAIPESWRERGHFYEQLTACVKVERSVAGRAVMFLVEPTRAGWRHPITPDDACRVLAEIPCADLAALDLIVMRQSTRKQHVLNPVWGRAVFAFAGAPIKGNAIVIEAVDGSPIAWPISLSPALGLELDRLRDDGHDVRRLPRRFEIRPTSQSSRNTVLHRTLLHELGHLVDRARCPENAWRRKPTVDKEAFAHRYAADAFARLLAAGVVPFAQRLDHDDLRGCNLDPAWFMETPVAIGEAP